MKVSDTTIATESVTVPVLGFGTWRLRGETARDAVAEALDVGYRHIDTAQLYDNEREVGRAVAASTVPRDEVFLTTKVWRDAAAPERLVRSTMESLDRLGVDHVDLLLLHWPADDVAPLEASLEAMSGLREKGLTRHIGVSNFPAAMFERACALAPVVNNQVEHHPYLSVDAIRAAAAQRSAFVTAYCPLAQGRVTDDPILVAIGEAHDVSAAQVTLRWHLQHGVSPIPRSHSMERIRANADIFDFALTDTEMGRIDALARGERLVHPAYDIDWDPA